jgi:triphosphoribosyl-dephospho-CoA synthase
MTPIEKKKLKISKIRKKLKLVVESTTPEDASYVYEAIQNANPGGLGKVSELDVTDPNSKARIHEQQVTLFNTFQIAANYDSICSEWVNNYPITFDIAYPFMIEQLTKVNDLNVAIVHTFLKVLGEYPDSLIARKTTLEKAKEVSHKAKTILSLGGLETSKGKKYLKQFDRELRKAGNLLNPGTTADIIAATLALTILEGYRP